jgi:hypothetical protein
MKKQDSKKSKLNIKKFQIAKIKNLQKIVGGNVGDWTGNTAKEKK